jgi:hypothetical protein
MSMQFVRTIVLLLGGAVAVALVVYALVYAVSGSRRSKRYRPGRPFEFTPVWFVSAPERQARAGISASPHTGRELVSSGGTPRPVKPMQTGGASDRW